MLDRIRHGDVCHGFFGMDAETRVHDGWWLRLLDIGDVVCIAVSSGGCDGNVAAGVDRGICFGAHGEIMMQHN